MYVSISSVCCQNCGLGFLVVNVDRSIGFSFLLLFVLGLEYIHWGKFQFRKKKLSCINSYEINDELLLIFPQHLELLIYKNFILKFILKL